MRVLALLILLDNTRLATSQRLQDRAALASVTAQAGLKALALLAALH